MCSGVHYFGSVPYTPSWDDWLSFQKRRRSVAEDPDMDEMDQHRSEADMMKKHMQQKLAVLQGETLRIEDEVDEVCDFETVALKNNLVLKWTWSGFFVSPLYTLWRFKCAAASTATIVHLIWLC